MAAGSAAEVPILLVGELLDNTGFSHWEERARPQRLVAATPIKVQAFLANLPLFRELQPTELDRIASGTREVHIGRGETLFRRGDPCEGFHAVVYGQIKLAFTSPAGAEKVVEIMGPGQSFGEAVMFMEKPYPVYTQALADSMLLHIAKATVFAEIEREPRFARRMIGQVRGSTSHLRMIAARLRPRNISNSEPWRASSVCSERCPSASRPTRPCSARTSR